MQQPTQPKHNKNYYQILGVNPDASQKEIDEAFKKLSNQLHPDKHKNNRREVQAKFSRLTEAYDVLSNRNRRAHYDQINHKEYTNEDAERTFERFYQEHGPQDEDEKKFIETHYPNRKRNYYETLGVSKYATMDEIKRAYRKLALQYHPKNNNNSEESRRRFNEVNEAYNALSTETRRHNYDIFQFGQIAPIRAQNIFENFWGDRFHELQQGDQFFQPILRSKWSRKLDQELRAHDNQDWNNVKQGQSSRTQTYYTNKNGVESKKSITTRTKIKDGVPSTETTQEYEYPDGNRQIRKIMDDGRGNVSSKVYNLKKGQNLPIQGQKKQ